jgi:hypothetical protein
MHKAYGLLPHLKITELLMEVGKWMGFTGRFTHIKSGDVARDKTLLLATILADAINLSPTKMAGSYPGTTYAKLSCLQACTSAMKPTRQPGPTWSTLVPASFCRKLGRWNNPVFRWTAVQGRRPGRSRM